MNFKLAAGGGGAAVHRAVYGAAAHAVVSLLLRRPLASGRPLRVPRQETRPRSIAHRSRLRPTRDRSSMRWWRCRPGPSAAEPADQRLVLDEHRLSAVGRLRPGAVGRRSTAGPDRLAALGRADHRQRPRCLGATPQQLPGALPAGHRRRVAKSDGPRPGGTNYWDWATFARVRPSR